MSVRDLLTTYAQNIYLDTDPGWHQFISDHKTYLKTIAERRAPSANLMTQMNYNLPRYLRSIGIPDPIAWIVIYLNDLTGEMAFDQSQTLYVPSIAQLQQLYQSYITTKTPQVVI